MRRSAWELVGGYSAEGLLELGWEDMDFWLRLAAAGQHGAHIRRIVGTYRVHGDSMSTVTNRHAAALDGVHARAAPRPDGRRMTPDELLTHLEAELARCRDERDRLSAELEAPLAERDQRAADGLRCATLLSCRLI